MRSTLFALPIALACLATPALAKEGGCLKYGAGGAAAGHFVGSGHAVLGAAAGCAVGSHVRSKAEQHDAQQNMQNNGPSDQKQ